MIRNVALLAITGLLVLAPFDIGIAADPGRYQVIYSKHDSLCTHAVEVLNNDLAENGFVTSPVHDPFDDIKWTRMRNSYINAFHATFDIDNDGDEETVINAPLTLKDVIEANRLLIYEASLDLKSRFTSKTFASHRESIDLNGWIYYLMACEDNAACFRVVEGAPQTIPDWKKDRVALSIRGAFIIHPFFFENETYISIRDWQPPDSRKWLVITRYFGGKVRDRTRKPGTPLINPESVEDQCYLERTN